MKKFFALMMAALMVVAMFAGCGSPEPAAEAPAAEGGTSDAAALKIGLTGPLTGAASAYGLAVQAGMEIGSQQIGGETRDSCFSKLLDGL